MKRWSLGIPRPSRRATWWASASTRAMRWTATGSAKTRARGAYVVFGGIHATLYPEEAAKLGGAHAVVKGDGDLVWARVLEDCVRNAPLPLYDGGKVEGGDFKPAR